MKPFYVYILASRRNGTLYVGSTDDLQKRVTEHQEGAMGGFTRRYGVHRLVWFEEFESRDEAFKCERRMKKWNRVWKLAVIERLNPAWEDLLPKLDEGFLPLSKRGQFTGRAAEDFIKSLGPRFRGDERN